jgi:predicted transcriptional regulator
MKGEFESFVEKIVEENVENHSKIEERVGYLCDIIALFDMRAQTKHESIIICAYNKKEDD